ncbi:MAG: hypothetical protein HQM09_02205 [Candidatus Riflebacteria bacterium]|nr:hypothetical protein [Candidatus Riflebacteria bacterium]
MKNRNVFLYLFFFLSMVLMQNQLLCAEEAAQPASSSDKIASSPIQVLSDEFRADLAEYNAAMKAKQYDKAMSLAEKWNAKMQDTSKFENSKEEFTQAFGQSPESLKNAISKEIVHINVLIHVEQWVKSVLARQLSAFEKDLAAFNGFVAIFNNPAKKGTQEWYDAAASAANLCEKWSQLCRREPKLAEEIKKVFKYDLPKQSDDYIKVLAEAAMADTTEKIKKELHKNGDNKNVVDLIKQWNKYLKDHPYNKAIIASVKGGQEFIRRIGFLGWTTKGLAGVWLGSSTVRLGGQGGEAGASSGSASIIASGSAADATDTEPVVTPTPGDVTPGTLGQSGN